MSVKARALESGLRKADGPRSKVQDPRPKVQGCILPFVPFAICHLLASGQLTQSSGVNLRQSSGAVKWPDRHILSR